MCVKRTSNYVRSRWSTSIKLMLTSMYLWTDSLYRSTDVSYQVLAGTFCPGRVYYGGRTQTTFRFSKDIDVAIQVAA